MADSSACGTNATRSVPSSCRSMRYRKRRCVKRIRWRPAGFRGCRALVLLVPADYLPAGTSIHGGAVVRAIFNSDFVAWAALKLMPIMPGEMTRMMLGTDTAVVRAGEPSEKARVQQILDHLLPVSPRFGGMQFDIKTAATHEPYPIEKIACPVMTISAEDDRFGTASRAEQIAT